MRGRILREGCIGLQWIRARREAKVLATALHTMETDFKTSDLDFFITKDGHIKIIDVQVTPTTSYTPEPGLLEGADEIKAVFGILE